MIEVRQTETFTSWFDGLRDPKAQAKIVVRIRRAQAGNLADVKPVGEGVSEMRITYGPGYRLYFVQRGETLIILLVGGDKKSQRRDIAKAKELAAGL
jgi:putative addiction module killer protein